MKWKLESTRVLIGTLMVAGSLLFIQQNAHAQKQELTGKIRGEERSYIQEPKKEEIAKWQEYTGEFSCSLLNDGTGRCLLIKKNGEPTIVEIPSSNELVGLSANTYRIYFWSSKELFEISIYSLTEASNKYDRRWIADGIKKVSGRHILQQNGRVRTLNISRYDSRKPPYLIETRKNIVDINQNFMVDHLGYVIEGDLYLTTEDGKKFRSNRNSFREY